MLLVKDVLANESYFKEGEKNYNEKKYEDSKFFFQRNMKLFHPTTCPNMLHHKNKLFEEMKNFS